MSKYDELKRVAKAATPQIFDSAEAITDGGWIDCPCCDGAGIVELLNEYVNYDDVAIGVQFYGIGSEFGAAEAYYRAANPAAVMALIADFDAEQALRLEAERQVGELRQQLDAQAKVVVATSQEAGALRMQAEQLREQLADNHRACQPSILESKKLQHQLDTAMGLLRRVAMRPSGCTAEVPAGWWNKRAELLLICMPSRNTTSTEGKDHG